MKWIWILLLIPALALGQNDAYPKSDASLVAWYKLDGNYVDEISGNSASIAATRSPTSTIDAKRGTGYYVPVLLDGVGLILVNATLLNGITTVSWVYWKKPTNSRISGTLMCLRKNDNSNFWGDGWKWDNANVWNFQVAGGPLTLQRTKVLNDWIFSATTYNGVRVEAFELSGKSQNLYWESAPYGAISQDRAVRLLSDYFTPQGFYYEGYFDEVMIFNRVITDNEIEQLYAGRWRLTLGEISNIRQGQGLGIGD